MLFSHQGGPSESEQLVINPFEEIVDSFRCWNDVEGRRNCSTVFKVGNPQLTTGKLPLRICLLLEQKTLKILEKDSVPPLTTLTVMSKLLAIISDFLLTFSDY